MQSVAGNEVGVPGSPSHGLTQGAPCPGQGGSIERGPTRVCGDRGSSGGSQVPRPLGSVEHQLGG